MKKLLGVVGILLSLASPGLLATSFQVTDIRLEGLQRISAGSVFSVLPIAIGDTVDDEALRASARALFATGNFDDIQIARDGTILVIVMAERPSISEINIEGNKAIETDALLDGLKGAGLSEGQVLKRATLEGMRLELQRQYVAQGRYDAEITTEVVQQPRNRVGVNINVDEGNVARIKHINVVGNVSYEDEDLLDLFELTDGGWFTWLSGTDKYSREKLQGDLEKLESHYYDNGFARFDIKSTQVAITPDRTAVYITVNLVEGDRYEVGAVELSGDLVVPADELQQFVIVKEGQSFSRRNITSTEELIVQRLGNDGYSFAEVSGRPTIDDETHKVDIKFFVDPGKRTYVNRISFAGNDKTQDQVLRREMRQMEGAPSSNNRIEQGKVRLNRLGFFKEVTVETNEVAGTDDQLDVEYTVEEQPSGSIGASVGFAQDSGILLGINLQQNNFFGTGKQVGIGMNASEYQTSASFNYVNPYYTEDGVSRGFSVFFRETDYDEVNVASYRTDVYGAAMNFGYPLSETQRLRFSLGGKHTNLKAGSRAVQEIIGSPRFPAPDIDEEFLPNRYITEFAVLDPATGLYTGGDTVVDLNFPEDDGLLFAPEDGFVDIYGDSFTDGTLSADWTQSTLDRGQLATRGASQSIGVEFTAPGSDLEYYKLMYNAQYFLPVSDTFTLRFRGEVGYGAGYGNNDELPFFENFFAGGFGSVRGFKSNTLGPRSTPAEQYIIQQPIREDGTLDPQYAYCLYNRDDPASVARCSGLSLIGQQDDKLGFGVLNTNDDRPFGGDVLMEGSVELLFPLPFIKDQRSMRTGMFLDFGNVYSTNCSDTQANCFGPEDAFAELRYSVGVGLTWITGFGPLTFSIAQPLNDEDADQTEFFQFSLGQFF